MKLLTPAHVAAELHIKPQTLRLKRMRGDGPPFIRLSDSPTARVYNPEAEFLAWLAACPRRISTTEEKRDSRPRGVLPRARDHGVDEGAQQVWRTSRIAWPRTFVGD